MLLRWAGAVLIGCVWLSVGAQQAPSQVDSYRNAMAHRDYPGALASAKAEVDAHPTAAQGWYREGMALHALHRDTEALLALEKARTFAPDDLRSAQAAAQLAYQMHDSRALLYAEAVLQLDPESSAAHGMAGVLQLESGHCDAAARHLLHSDVSSALDAATRVRLAACVQMAQPSAAVTLLSPLRSAGTLSAAAYSILAAAYAAADQVPQAVEVLREGCNRFPLRPELFADLAILSMDHQSPEVALSVLGTGIEANPGAADLFTLRGSVYAQLAQNDKAAADFEHADRLAPNRAYGALGLGMLLRDGSNLEEAQKRLETKLRELPGEALLSYTLADVLMREGANPGDANFARAEALLHDAVKRDSTLAQAYALLGKLELRRGDTLAATRDLEQAVQLNSHDRAALNQLIAAYRRSNRSADAARVSEQLARSADEERRQEVESNRIHLTLGSPEPRSPAGSSHEAR